MPETRRRQSRVGEVSGRTRRDLAITMSGADAGGTEPSTWRVLQKM
jgi:hypothetical protein